MTNSTSVTVTQRSGNAFFEYMGFQVSEWDSDYIVLTLHVGPQHLNLHGTLHGGVLTAMIDNACAMAGCYCPTPGHIRKALTLTLTTSFTGQASLGTIRALGRKRSGGRRIFVSTTEIIDENGNLIAIGEATNRYARGSELLHGVPA